MIKPISPKGNQLWISIGRTDVEAEAPILWPPDSKSWLIRKDPDAGKDWQQEKKQRIEDKTVGQHHQLNGHEFEQALGDGEGEGILACYSPWGHKESDTSNWMTDRMGEEFWDCWAPGGGLANQAPGLTTFQVSQDKTNSINMNWSEIDDDISLCAGIINRNPNCNLWSLTYGADMLPATFSQLGLQMYCDMGIHSTV